MILGQAILALFAFFSRMMVCSGTLNLILHTFFITITILLQLTFITQEISGKTTSWLIIFCLFLNKHLHILEVGFKDM